MWAQFRESNPPAGFTLVELVIVIVALGILSVYAATSFVSPSEATLRSQAEQFARDIRHVQMLATTRGAHLRLSTSASGYSVTCVSGGGPTPCSGAVIDPATGKNFSVTLQGNVSLSPTSDLDFDGLGRPLAVGAYTLSAGSSASMSISVSPVTGFVAVAPL